MKKTSVTLMILLGLASSANAGSLGASVEASKKVSEQMSEATQVAFLESKQAMAAIFHAVKRSEAVGVVEGPVGMVVASAEYVGNMVTIVLKPIASPIYNHVLEPSAELVLRMSKDVANLVLNAANITLTFTANTVMDSMETVSAELVLASKNLSQSKLTESLKHIKLAATNSWQALMSPDQRHADRYRNFGNWNEESP
ncbi:MAG: hypothetical protein NZ480_03515 [Bdellovibrionaceae bacterium]|nr:hypothetical protein [Pseudobdellovibrionaceae bacterium]MDW8190226.1 hypothetical protein [Pseudobdellovibrionaceae bacterium]